MSTYEFNAKQNAIFANLVRWMRTAAVILLGFAGVQLVGALNSLPTHLAVLKALPGLRVVVILNLTMAAILIVSQLIVGVGTLVAASGFRRVVDTKGNDLAHLMVALEQLRKTYRLISSALIATLVLMAVWWFYNLYFLKNTLQF